MPISKSQRERRRAYIGASDVAAILGVDPWRSPWDVWASKTRGVDDPPNAATRAGDHFENGLIDFALGQLHGDEAATPLGFDRQRAFERGRLLVHPDGCRELPSRGVVYVIEAKTVGVVGPASRAWREQWGQDGTSQVPMKVRVQTHAQMHASGAPIAYVPTLRGWGGVAMYVVPRDDALATLCAESAEAFYDAYVATDTPPPIDDQPPTLRLARRLPRREGIEIGLPDSFIDEVAHAREQVREWTKRKEAAEARLLATMDGAACAVADCGRARVKTVARKGYTVSPSQTTRLEITAREQR